MLLGLPLSGERESIQIGATLEDVAAGRGRTLLIEGAAGLGKSWLLADIARAALMHGFSIASVRALPEGRQVRGWVLKSALARCDEQLASTVNDGVVPLLERSSTLEPLALLIDDAHHADRLSLRLLVELAERIHSRPILVVTALRPYLLEAWQRHLITDLNSLEHTQTLTLRPLVGAQAKRIVRLALPDATPGFCFECTQLTGGNPFLLGELVTWIAAKGLQPKAGAPSRALEPVPERRIREFVRAQLDDLGPDAAAVAVAAAISERELSLNEATSLVGFTRARVIDARDALLESGLIAAPGEPLRFAAPVAARCLRAEAPPLGGPDGAYRLLLAPPSGNPHVVEELVELADHEVAYGHPREAQVLIRRAIAEHVNGEHAKPRLLARLGHIDLLQGRPTSTVSLAAAVAGLKPARERAETLLDLGVAQIAAGAPQDASVAFDAARDAVTVDDPLRARAETTSVLVSLLVPEQRAAALARLERLKASPDLEQQPWGTEVLLASAWKEVGRAAPSAEVARLTQRAIELRGQDDSWLGGYFGTVAASLLAFTDDLSGAERISRAGQESARAAGSVLAQRSLAIGRALALLHAGRLSEAAEQCQSVLSPKDDGSPFHRAGAAVIQANVLMEQDAPAEAATVLEAGVGSASTELPHMFLLEATARLCLWRGNLAEALSAVEDARYLAESLGIVNPAVAAWQPIAAICYARLGNRRRARELAREAAEIAEQFGAPRTIAMTLRGQARVAGGPAELEHLERALALIESSEAALERARVLVHYGTALHRAGDDHAARIWLHRGVDLAHQLGAGRIGRTGLTALVAAGGRPRRIRMTGPEALTPAERRVADLASSGLSNRGIAEVLAITLKTVEWHLRKAFVKLGVNSRKDLAGALGETGAEDVRSAMRRPLLS